MNCIPIGTVPIRLFPRTLRLRLAIWNAIVVLATSACLLLAVRAGVRWTILHEIDTILEEDLSEMTLAMRALEASRGDATLDGIKEELARKAIGHRRHGWFAVLLADDQQPIWSTLAGTTEFSPNDANRHPTTIDGKRVVATVLDRSIRDVSGLLVGAELSFLDDDMRRLDQLLWAAVAVLAFVAPILGYGLAARAARTVGELIDTAGTLRPARLGDRLPVRGTGDELDQLAGTINGLLDRLADFVDRKREFLAHAAHDLRTPLAAIRSSVEVALAAEESGRLDDRLNPLQRAEVLADVIEEVAALETLVNQLLLLSESDVDRMAIDADPVPVSTVVAKAVDMFAGVAEQSEVTLSADVTPDLKLTGNRHLIRQLANNLIDNAIKYTPSGGSVRVTLDLRDDRSDRPSIVLRVQDTGIGIEQADVERIFDRFFRVEASRTRLPETTGTGLGLAICQAVAEAHGGSIDCKSQPGHGTIMTAELPSSSSPGRYDVV